MKIANIAEFKNSIGLYIKALERGEVVELRRRNVPLAKIIPVRQGAANQTRLGAGKGSAMVLGDLTAPFIEEDSWDMLAQKRT